MLTRLHVGVVVHAPDSRILFSNTRAAQLLGLSEAQMLGKTAVDPAWHFVDAQGRPLEVSQYPINTVLATGQTMQETDLGVVSPQRDSITWLSVSAFPEFDAAGQLERVVVNFHDISERRRVQAELDSARVFALSVLDGLASAVCVLDMHGTIIAVNRCWKTFYAANGGSPDQIHEGTNYLQGSGAAATLASSLPDALSFADLLQQVLAGDRDYFEWEYACHSPVEKRWFIARVSRMQGVSPLRVVVAHDNVTAAMLGQEHLREALSFTHQLIEAMQDGFSVLDRDGRATHANPALCRMTGFSEAELVSQTAPFSYWPVEEYERIDAAFRQTLAGQGDDFKLTFMRKNGERFPVSVAASAVRDDTGQPTAFLATVKDITQLQRLEDEIERLAFHDPLTGLPNRRLFDDRLQQAQASAARGGRYGGVLLIDLDSFKPVNDLHGHNAGDQLLVEAARRLKACLREVDTAARLGGDEFVVVIADLGHERGESIDHLQAIAEKIRQALEQGHQLVGDAGTAGPVFDLACTASIGAALFDGKNIRGAEAMRVADRAMYDAKRGGGNQVRLA